MTLQAAAGAEFVLNKLNGKTAYLLRDNSTEYTTLLAKYFEEAYTHGGGRIILKDEYGGRQVLAARSPS